MPDAESTSRPQSRLWRAILLVVAFLFLRLTLVTVRDVFFDELFTRWIVRFSPARILEYLRADSGPPLYYFLASLLPDAAEVFTLRILSVVFSLGALVAILLMFQEKRARIAAAAVLATLPVHMVMSGDARAYALLATLTGVATLALWRWNSDGGGRWLTLATVALTAAVWTHWYGCLFAPQILAAALLANEQRRRRVIEALVATSALALMVTPALFLLASQPPEAAAWMLASEAASPLETIASMTFALAPVPAFYEAIAPVAVPRFIRLVAFVTFAVAFAVVARRRDAKTSFFAAMTLIPIAGVIVLVASGRPAYFPGRFESALAVPVACLLALGYANLDGRIARGAAALWMGLTLGVWTSWMIQMPQQLEDPWRLTARFAREAVPSDATIIATGPMYLELLSQQDDAWTPSISAFPAGQASHPGWRERRAPEALQAEVNRLPGQASWWVGEAGGPEAKVLATRYRLLPEFRAGPVVLLRLSVRDGGDEAGTSSRSPE